jgi:hypothetical protein
VARRGRRRWVAQVLAEQTRFAERTFARAVLPFDFQYTNEMDTTSFLLRRTEACANWKARASELNKRMKDDSRAGGRAVPGPDA